MGQTILQKSVLPKPVQDIRGAGFSQDFRRDTANSQNGPNGPIRAMSKQGFMAENLRSLDLITDRSLQAINEVKFLVVNTSNFDSNPTLGSFLYINSVPHQLGYEPVFLAEASFNNDEYFSPCPLFKVFVTSFGYRGSYSVNMRCTSTDIFCNVFLDGLVAFTTFGFPLTIKIFLFREQINGKSV